MSFESEKEGKKESAFQRGIVKSKNRRQFTIGQNRKKQLARKSLTTAELIDEDVNPFTKQPESSLSSFNEAIKSIDTIRRLYSKYMTTDGNLGLALLETPIRNLIKWRNNLGSNKLEIPRLAGKDGSLNSMVSKQSTDTNFLEYLNKYKEEFNTSYIPKLKECLPSEKFSKLSSDIDGMFGYISENFKKTETTKKKRHFWNKSKKEGTVET